MASVKTSDNLHFVTTQTDGGEAEFALDDRQLIELHNAIYKVAREIHRKWGRDGSEHV